MPSERRLHPLSILFNIGKRFGALLIPILLVLAGRGTDEDRWNVYALVFLVPYGVAVLGSYLTYRYRYEPAELVIRRGLIFRTQRHIPYNRIQNIDAVQNVLHRLTGVVEVKVQTAGGSEPEATLSVLSLADLEEMRRRVFGRPPIAPDQERGAAAEPSGPPVRVLLHLPPRELVVYALVENRGLVVIAAALGLLSESSLFTDWMERLLGDEAGRGIFRRLAHAAFADGGPSPRAMLLAALGLTTFLLVSRLFSIAWAQVRLHGYSVTQTGEDLRAEYGLFTRVTATIPVRRIQAVTVRDTPLHRLLGRASIRVATAGGGASEHDRTSQHREWIAPVIRRDEIPAFLAALLPGTNPSTFEWRTVHPGAFRRMMARASVVNLLLALLAAAALGGRALWLLPGLMLLSAVRARRQARYLAWTTTPDVAAVRQGAFVRVLTIAPLARLQVVETHESPFDRRTAMRRVRADTAGGVGLDVPFLAVDEADDLYGRLATAAAHTEFRW